MVTIFYVTYSKDLLLLKHSLLSVVKYVKGEYDISIVYHDECEQQLKDMLAEIKVPASIYPVKYHYHGYLKQMEVKLTAYKYTRNDTVVYVDCDCIFYTEYDLNRCYVDKIPWRYQIRGAIDDSGVFTTWQRAVKDTTLCDMNHAYMVNGFPFIVRTKTLIDAEKLFVNTHHKSYEAYIHHRMCELNIPINSSVLSNWPTIATVFEEFEYIGWFAHNYSNDYYFYTDNMYDNGPSPIRQYWSHGDISKQYEEMRLLYEDK